MQIHVIKAIRHRRGLTQLELARRSDLYRQDISNIERGKRRLTPYLKQKIQRGLGLID